MKARKLPSGSWSVEAYAGYDPVTKKRYRKTFTGKDLRQVQYRASLWAMKNKGFHAPDSIAVVIDRYIANAALSPSTRRGYVSLRRNYPEWLLKTPAHALSAPLCERFISEMDKSPKSIKNAVGLLTAALKASDLPVPFMRLPQVPLPKLNIPDAEVVKKTLEAADPEMYIVIMLAATAPLRLGEICALDLSDIDRETCTIHVHKNMVYGSDHAYHVKAPKTERSDRYIDMQRDLVDKIFAQGYVTRFTPKGIEKRFRTILRHAGIPHYRFHDLRHFCISELLLQGLPESYVSERSGHTSHATMQRYIHVLGNRRAEASKKILAHFDDVLG